jgi:hypothetical protein
MRWSIGRSVRMSRTEYTILAMLSYEAKWGTRSKSDLNNNRLHDVPFIFINNIAASSHLGKHMRAGRVASDTDGSSVRVDISYVVSACRKYESLTRRLQVSRDRICTICTYRQNHEQTKPGSETLIVVYVQNSTTMRFYFEHRAPVLHKDIYLQRESCGPPA